MKLRLRHLKFWALVLLLVTGGTSDAQTSRRVPLDLARIDGLRCGGVMAIPQKEIAPEAHVSTRSLRNSLGERGWLVNAIIDGWITGKKNAEAERAIVPFQLALREDPTKQRFFKAFEELPLPCRANEIRLLSDNTELKELPDDQRALWIVRLAYSMSPDSKYLTAYAAVTLSASRAAMTSPGKAAGGEVEQLYSNLFTYIKKLDAVGSTSELASLWLAEDAKRLKDGLNEIALGLAALLLSDTESSGDSMSSTFELKIAGRTIDVRRETDGSLVVLTE